MTLPRFWTDPLLGSSYPVGSRLPAADMNAYVSGLRNLDKANEHQVVLNWPYKHSDANWDTTSGICWVPTYRYWVESRQDHGTPANPAAYFGRQVDYMISGGAVPAGVGLTVLDICASTSVVVMCGVPGSSSDQKYRYSADGAASWSIGNSATASTTPINAVAWFGAVSLFVSGASNGNIETSPTGATWTSRATVTSIGAIACSSTLAVAVHNASTNKCRTSANGTSWDERTMATTAVWTDVCWAEKQGCWVAVGEDGSSNICLNKSTDAITWEAVTVSSGLSLAYTPGRLVSSGNAIILATSAGIFVSFDLGVTWRCAEEAVAASSGVKALGVAIDPDSIVCQLFAVGEGATTTEYYASLIGS